MGVRSKKIETANEKNIKKKNNVEINKYTLKKKLNNASMKGFTVIELVASFVIVAMLLGVGMIAYSSIYQNATESYYHTLESSLMLSGSDYFQDHRELLPANSYSIVSIQDLVNENYTDEVKDQNGNICLNGEVIVYKGKNNNYQYEVCLRCGGYQSEGSYCEGYEVDAKRVKIPTNILCKAKNKATYNGSTMSLTIIDEAEGFTLSGNQQKNANEDLGYTITATLKDGYTWSDDSVEPKTFTCKLYKRTPVIEIIPYYGNVVNNAIVQFNEKADTPGTFVNKVEDPAIVKIQSITPVSNSENKVVVKGLTDDGSTDIIINFTPDDLANYNEITDKDNIRYKVITQNGVEKPTAAKYCKTDLVYNNTEYVLTKDAEFGFSFKNNKAIDADKYTVTAVLDKGFIWKDNTSADVSFECQIAKKPVTVVWVGTNIFTYNSSPQAPKANANTGIDTEKMTLSVINPQTNYGNYTAEIGCQRVDGGQRKCSNYELKGTTKAYQILKRSVKLKPLAQTIVYGNAIVQGNSRVEAVSGSIAPNDVLDDNNGMLIQIGKNVYDTTKRIELARNHIFIKNKKGVNVTDNYEISFANGNLTIEPRPVKILADDAQKVYDGTPLKTNGCRDVSKISPYALSGIADSDKGIVNNESLACTMTSNSTITNFYDGPNGKKDNVIYNVQINGRYILQNGSQVSNTNYTIYTEKGTLSIVKKAIKVKAGDANKIYDGKALTTNDCSDVSNSLISGEKLSCSMTSNSTITNFYDGNSSGQKSNVLYNVWINSKQVLENGAQVATSNYAITTIDGTLSITKRAITIRAASTSKTYDGKALTTNNCSDVSPNKTTGGVVSGESLACTMTAASTITNYYDGTNGKKNNVLYGVVINGQNVLQNGSQVATANYAITTEIGEISIVKRAVTIKANDNSKTYDGKVLTTNGCTDVTSNKTTGGVVSGESLSCTMTSASKITNYFDTSNGKKDNVLYNVSINGRNVLQNGSQVANANYAITTQKGTLTIIRRLVTIKANDKEKTYDGKALTTNGCTDVTVDKTTGGIVSGESLVCTMTTGSTITNYWDTGDGKKSNVISTVTIAGRNGNTNYNISTQNGTLTINKRNVTILAGSTSKTYDGTALTTSSCSVSGGSIVSGESLSCSMTSDSKITNYWDTSNGKKDNVIATVTIAGRNGNTNYNISTSKGTLTINKRAVTILAASTSKTYDGSALTTSACSVSSGSIVSGESLSCTMTSASTITYYTDGTNGQKNNTISSVTIAGRTGNTNYNISTSTGTLTIYRRELGTYVSSCNNKVYDEGTSASCSIGITNNISGDAVSAYGTCNFSDANVGTNKTVTCSSISLSGGRAGNYYIASSNTTKYGTATITKQQIYCPSSPSSQTYSDSWKNSNIYCPRGSSAEGTTSAYNAGTYYQLCTADSNHYFSSTCRVGWTIDKASLSCPRSPSDKDYTGSTIDSGIFCPSGSNAGGTTYATDAGTYYQTCTADSNHYFPSTCRVGWTIDKASLSCPRSPSSQNYNGDTKYSGVRCPSGSSNDGTTSAIGAGTYYHTCVPDSNHTFGSSGCSVSWTVNKIASSVTCSNKYYSGGWQTIASCNGCSSSFDPVWMSAGSYSTSYMNAKGDSNHYDPPYTTCYIYKADASITCSSKTYNGYWQTIASCTGCSSSFDASKYSAGTYTISGYGDSNHNNPSSKTCYIYAASLSCPSSPSDKDYTGSTIDSGIFCPSGSSPGGTTYATDVGTYYQTCTADSNHYFSSTCSVSWKIKNSCKWVLTSTSWPTSNSTSTCSSSSVAGTSCSSSGNTCVYYSGPYAEWRAGSWGSWTSGIAPYSTKAPSDNCTSGNAGNTATQAEVTNTSEGCIQHGITNASQCSRTRTWTCTKYYGKYTYTCSC